MFIYTDLHRFSTPTQMNDFVHYFYTINENKESVEPDVKLAAVMNPSTLEGFIHFMTTRWPQHEPF